MDNQNVCPNCKAMIPPGCYFCPHCGQKADTADFEIDQTLSFKKHESPVYLESGTILHGEYRINRVIGQGGFGITYDGTGLNLHMHVAIKEYFPDQIAERQGGISKMVVCGGDMVSFYERGMRNFLKEARNMAKFVGEENFVSVHDFFEENNTAYIVMEFVEGQDLRHYLRRHGQLSMEEAAKIMLPVQKALEKIHSKGMIHRDISPSNIMIRPDGRVKLLDFGAVADMSAKNQTRSEMSSVYKYGYSPIEQQTRDMQQGTWTDVYAFCATLYQMLTGQIPPSPFVRLSGEKELIPPSRLGARLSRAQEETLIKGLAVYGRDRIQKMEELEILFRNNGKGGFSSGGGGNAWKRKMLSRAAAIAALVILVVGTAFLTLQILELLSEKKADKDAEPKEAAASETPSENEDKDGDGGGSQDSADSAGGGEAQAENSSSAEENEQEQETVIETENATEKSAAVPEKKEQDPAQDLESAEEEAAAEETDYSYEYPEGTLSFRGHHYYIYDDVRTSWEDAREKCLERGGYLAVINDAEENEALYEYMLDGGYEEAFFGLSYDIEKKDWFYLNGDTSSFRDWGYNSKGEPEPNHADRGENYAELDVQVNNGYWNDAQFGKKTYTPNGTPYKNLYTYICEWDQ